MELPWHMRAIAYAVARKNVLWNVVSVPSPLCSSTAIFYNMSEFPQFEHK